MIPSLYRQSMDPLHPARRSSTSSSPSPYIGTAGGSPLPISARQPPPTSSLYRHDGPPLRPRLPIYPPPRHACPSPDTLSLPSLYTSLPPSYPTSLYTFDASHHPWTMNPNSSPGATSASGCADRARSGTSPRRRRSVRCARDAGPLRPPWRAPAAGMPGSRAPTSLPRGARSATARTGTA